MVHELNKINAGKASRHIPISPAGLDPGKKLSNVITVCPDGSITVVVAGEGFEKKILCLCRCHGLHIFIPPGSRIPVFYPLRQAQKWPKKSLPIIISFSILWQRGTDRNTLDGSEARYCI